MAAPAPRSGADTSKLVQGRELQLKFRLPLYRKEFFEVSARIETVTSEGDACDLTMHFTQMSDDDRHDIEGFVTDMQELRDAARGGS